MCNNNIIIICVACSWSGEAAHVQQPSVGGGHEGAAAHAEVQPHHWHQQQLTKVVYRKITLT